MLCPHAPLSILNRQLLYSNSSKRSISQGCITTQYSLQSRQLGKYTLGQNLVDLNRNAQFKANITMAPQPSQRIASVHNASVGLRGQYKKGKSLYIILCQTHTVLELLFKCLNVHTHLNEAEREKNKFSCTKPKSLSNSFFFFPLKAAQEEIEIQYHLLGGTPPQLERYYYQLFYSLFLAAYNHLFSKYEHLLRMEAKHRCQNFYRNMQMLLFNASFFHQTLVSFLYY